MTTNPNRRRAQRRASDRWRMVIRENWYRDVWLILTTVVVVVALIRAQDAIDAQNAGRRAAGAVTCSAISAVIDAGRATIDSGGRIDPRKFERNLERLGLPPRDVRARKARTAAESYARLIAQRVTTESGVPGLVRRDGTLNCERLGVVARSGRP